VGAERRPFRHAALPCSLVGHNPSQLVNCVSASARTVCDVSAFACAQSIPVSRYNSLRKSNAGAFLPPGWGLSPRSWLRRESSKHVLAEAAGPLLKKWRGPGAAAASSQTGTIGVLEQAARADHFRSWIVLCILKYCGSVRRAALSRYGFASLHKGSPSRTPASSGGAGNNRKSPGRPGRGGLRPEEPDPRFEPSGPRQ
jgi:hypothetical protein